MGGAAVTRVFEDHVMRTQNIHVPSVWEHAWCTSPWKQCSSPEKQSSGTCVRSDDQPRLAITVIDEIIEHSSSHTARWRRAYLGRGERSERQKIAPECAPGFAPDLRGHCARNCAAAAHRGSR